MGESVTTVVTDRATYSAGRTPGRGPELGPVMFHIRTGAIWLTDYLEVGEAEAIIASLQVAVEDVEREGREAFDAHIAGKLAETKFISMPVSGVSANG
jgi:hypothetical protein